MSRTPVRVFPLREYGPVAPSVLVQPVREVPVRFGKGIMVEEGTTNLVANPSVKPD